MVHKSAPEIKFRARHELTRPDRGING